MQAIIAASQGVPYRMCLTATPCPNDYAEILNQAAFLGIATRDYLLATYFRTLLTGKVVLRKHAAASFVRCAPPPSLLDTQCVVENEKRPLPRWLSTWSVWVTSPCDVGFDAEAAHYILPVCSGK